MKGFAIAVFVSVFASILLMVSFTLMIRLVDLMQTIQSVGLQ